MEDTTSLLKQSRQYFRSFLKANGKEIAEDAREYRISQRSGYGPFYKSDLITRALYNIDANIVENFKNLDIPKDFPSPKRLAETWKAFYQYILEQEDLISEVGEKIELEAKKKYGEEFKHLKSHGMIFPEPFKATALRVRQFKDVLEHILSMEEVQVYLADDTKTASSNQKQDQFDVIIITALYDTEFEALLSLPVKPEKFVELHDKTDYWKCVIGNVSVLLATDDTMGIAAASSLTTKLIIKFSPKYIIMAGIAAGVKDTTKNYGDIMICRWAFNYESGKYKFSKEKAVSVFEPNPEQVEIDAGLISKLNNLKSQKNILSEIQDAFNEDERNKKPGSELNVWVAPIASGSAVVADSKKIEDIRAGNRKLIGIDMETFGVMYATKKIPEFNTKAVCVKSISDFADHRKNDKFRKYAAHTSAQFVYQLIKNELQKKK